MDSGMVVVILIITCLIIITFSFLLFVDYEWCHVLYKNNTVGGFNHGLTLPKTSNSIWSKLGLSLAKLRAASQFF